MVKYSITHCPHCRQSLTIFSGGDSPEKTTFESVAPALGGPPAPTHPPVSDWQKNTPVGRLSPDDVKTSLYDAVVACSYTTVGAAGGAWYFGWPWYTPPAVGFVVFGLRYFGGMRLAQSLLEIVESLTHRDLDGNGQVGAAKPEPPLVVRVETKSEDSRRWQFADLPGQPAAVQALAAAVLAGGGFTERTAVDCGLTQEAFGKIRDLFIDRGWAKWNHPDRRQQGVTLHRGGMSVLRAIAETPIPGGAGGEINAPGSTQQHAARGVQ